MIFFSFSEWFVIALEHEFQRWASSAANSVKCATHMVNLGAATHQFVLLSNRNSASVGSFHDDLLIDRFFSHFCCILFPLSFIDLYISCFYGLQWILYCTWYLFMDYFVISSGASAARSAARAKSNLNFFFAKRGQKWSISWIPHVMKKSTEKWQNFSRENEVVH